jgi:hypothetical protein
MRIPSTVSLTALVALAIISGCVPPGAPVTAPAEKPEEPFVATLTVEAGDVAVHSEPSRSAPVVESLRSGDRLRLRLFVPRRGGERSPLLPTEGAVCRAEASFRESEQGADFLLPHGVEIIRNVDLSGHETQSLRLRRRIDRNHPDHRFSRLRNDDSLSRRCLLDQPRQMRLCLMQVHRHHDGLNPTD